MIKDNEKYFNRLQLVLDTAAIIISYIVAWYLIPGGKRSEEIGVLPTQIYMMALIFIVPFFLLLYSACNLYTSKRIQGRRLEGGKIIQANLIGGLTFMAVLYVIRQEHISRPMIVLFLCLNVVLTILERNAVRIVLMNLRRTGFNLRHIILVGYSRASEEFINRVLQNPQWGYKILGILDDNLEQGYEYRGVSVLGVLDALEIILGENSLDEIAITLGLNEYDKLQRIVSVCEKSGVHTKFIPDYSKIIPTKPYTEDLLGLPVINIRHVPLNNTFNMMVKRVMDICGSLACLVLFSPVMLITAVLIKTTSKGPLIFKQERVGLHNKPFQMYKFRSMEVQTRSEEKKGWTVKDDPRVTRVGRIIRKTSIDELPQLINVLKGDMSLVGPRPERPQYVEKFREEIPRYMVKHQVRPGMTGWAQVNGYRGNTSIRKRIEHDLYYIENWSVGLDIKILILTVFKGFVNKNAY
ncbi:MAG: undecaprenyl-phosphate glucose phosphotransferase [Lachnospiraceae bacterium]|nr:undecaprenyl-phosphate glucose phosphotransferase [Lachnospiraceae bacterium]